jgi:hypothetical protein
VSTQQLARPEISAESVSGAILAFDPPEVLIETPSGLSNTAAKAVGLIHSLAVAKKIQPPERALFELDAEAQEVVLYLFQTATNPNTSKKSRKPLNPDTERRIGRVISYSEIDESATA